MPTLLEQLIAELRDAPPSQIAELQGLLDVPSDSDIESMINDSGFLDRWDVDQEARGAAEDAVQTHIQEYHADD